MAPPAGDHGAVPGESFDARVHDEDGRIVVTVRGELDMATEADARRALAEAERRPGGPVLIDLSEVTFMGSNGLRALLESVESLEAQRRVAELIASKPVEQVISLAGLAHRFTFRVGQVGEPSGAGSRGREPWSERPRSRVAASTWTPRPTAPRRSRRGAPACRRARWRRVRPAGGSAGSRVIFHPSGSTARG